jgi:hypothetical protein
MTPVETVAVVMIVLNVVLSIVGLIYAAVTSRLISSYQEYAAALEAEIRVLKAGGYV